MTTPDRQETPGEPESRNADLDNRLGRMEARLSELEERAPQPPWSNPVRWLLGVLAVLFVIGLIAMIISNATTARGIKIAAAVFAGAGTLTQAFLATDGGPTRREGETAEGHRRRRTHRDRWDVVAWAAISVSVMVVAVAEIAN